MSYQSDDELCELLRKRTAEINTIPTTLQPTRPQQLLEKAAWLMNRAADRIDELRDHILEMGERDAN